MNKYINNFIEFPSPAKLNLFLHVVGQRKDGYHELETLFQFLNYSDTIEILVTKNSAIELLTPIDGVNNEDNLIVKAALLLQKELLQKELLQKESLQNKANKNKSIQKKTTRRKNTY